MAQERLDKIIASMTSFSRKDVRKLIRDGQVLVAGVKASSADQKCDPERDRVTVNGQELFYEQFLYLMMNKPQGVVTATTDSMNRTVMDLLPREYAARKLFPVGRLDKDSEGLLLITDDGELAHRLLSPGRHVEKEYSVIVEGALGNDAVEAFARGITLADGTLCREAKLMVLDQAQKDGMITTSTRVTICEGKYHQIKRMFGVMQMPVLSLKRIRMGNLVLDPALSPGQFRKLASSEIEALKSLEKPENLQRL